MRIQFDWEIRVPGPLVRFAGVIAVPTVLLLTATTVKADVPFAFAAGQPLSAQQLNANFTDLDERVTTLETAPSPAPTVVENSSDANQTGAHGQDLVYTGTSLTLGAGTWHIQAFASVYTTDVADAVQLGLYDAGAAADVPASRSPISHTTPASVGLVTSKVITLSNPTTIQMKLYRNGSSTPAFGYVSALANGRQRMLAIRLD